MKLTLENKAKFFAKYWGQQIAVDPMGFLGYTNDAVKNKWIDQFHLELTPISSITDEDALELSTFNQDIDTTTGKFVFSGKESAIRYIKNNIYFLMHKTRTADYLRSKGYALPWMGISIDEMIHEGWIKLKS